MDSNGDDGDAHRDAYAAGRDITVSRNVTISIGGRPGAGTRVREDKLAALVLKQAQEKRSRLIGTDRPEDDAANVGYAKIPARLRQADGRDIGDLRSILEYYQSLSPQRLVIIGAPGAGKTVLLLELQIRLLEQRRTHPDTPVPVLLSASGYDTAARWEDWLAGQVSLEFSIRKRKAAALVADGRILPLIDGLDEMDPAGDDDPERAQALVRALNTWMRAREKAPVVVACRPGEYDRLAEGIDKARHAQLSGLTGPEAAEYLHGQFRETSERDRWAPVLETLERNPDGPLTAELTTPWKLTLALTAFRADGDPARLLPPAGIAGSDYSAYAQGLLFEEYVPSAVRLHREGTPYTSPKVQRWLASLTSGLARQARSSRSATDITLHEWRLPQDNWMTRIRYAALMLLPFLALSMIGVLTGISTIKDAPMIAVFALSASGSFFSRARSQREIPDRDKLRSGLTNGLATGLMCGLTYGFSYGLWGSGGSWSQFTYLLQHGVYGGFWFDPVSGLSAGLAYGLIAGLAAGLTSRSTNGLAIGFTTWLAFAIAFGLSSGLADGWSEAAYRDSFAHTYGLTAGMVHGLGDAYAAGIEYGLVYGLIAGLVAGLTNRFTNFSPKAREPQTIIRTNSLIGLAAGTAAGLAVSFAIGPAASFVGAIIPAPFTNAHCPLSNIEHCPRPWPDSGFAGWFSRGSVYGWDAGWAYGLSTGVVNGLLFGLTVWFAISARIWVRYYLITAWDACRGRTPLRFGKFLGWAVRAGLLREAGISYQFRHRQLQDWLTPGSTHDAPPAAPGPPLHPVA